MQPKQEPIENKVINEIEQNFIDHHYTITDDRWLDGFFMPLGSWLRLKEKFYRREY